MIPELYVWISILLFILGILALILEVFLVPGFGVSGVAGIIFIAWGIMLLSSDVAQTTMSLVIALIATLAVFIAGVKLSTKFNVWQRLTLGTKQEMDLGYSAPMPDLINYKGRTGTALTPLRPSGTIDVSGHRLDVVTGGEYIPQGTSVQVVQVEGARVVVRAIEE